MFTGLQRSRSRTLRQTFGARDSSDKKGTEDGGGKQAEAVPEAPVSGGEGGLLVQPKGKVFGKIFIYAIWMELIGTMLFTLFGSVSPYPFGAVGNGIMLAVLVYITANVSGGHLNPAVSLAAIVTGHISLVKGFLYIAAQIGGAMIGSLLVVGLVPGSRIGQTSFTCFQPGESVSKGQAFAWEFFSTFILVATVYAVAIGKPSFGNVGPLIVGASLWACASCAGQYSSAALNPARVLGPATVFAPCHPGDVWYYVLAELLGGLVAGLMSMPLYGKGPDFARAMDHDKDHGKASDDGGIDMQDKSQNEERMANMQQGQMTESHHSLTEPHRMQQQGGRQVLPSPPLADRV